MQRGRENGLYGEGDTGLHLMGRRVRGSGGDGEELGTLERGRRKKISCGAPKEASWQRSVERDGD